MKKLMYAGLVSLVSISAIAQSGDESKFMRFTLGADPIIQIGFAKAALCKAYDEASQKQGAPTNGVKFSCSSTSVGSLLPYEAVLRDEYFGDSVTVAAKTELMCLNSAAELLKLKDTIHGRPVFTAVSACKLKS